MKDTKSTFDGFTAEERDAMKEHAQELKTAARRSPRTAKADGEGDVLAKIAEMPDDQANLDDGTMWPTSYALTDLNPANEARISELVRKAAN